MFKQKRWLLILNLDNFFKGQNVAVIGVSRNPNKIGHVIFKNLVDGSFKGKVFIVNPNAEDILNHKAYASVTQIEEKVDVAVIAIPAEFVIPTLNECGKKGIRHVVLITSGFKEIGNLELEKKLYETLKKNRIIAVGPNCLGTFDAYTGLDSLFLPKSRMKRPKPGGISFICQSGAVGSTILDLASDEGYGFAKFISYGNATNLDETDLMEYLANDEETKVICMYIEGIKDGKKFLKVARDVAKKKPVIAIKAGVTEAGSKATLSHTGSLAGAAEVYLGAFKQAGIIRARSLREMFDFAKVFEKSIPPKGKRVQIITNGGGYGILSADAVLENELPMAQMSKKTHDFLKKNFSPIAIVNNPMDLAGDADTNRYKLAIGSCLEDKNIDIILTVLLYQTPLISPDVTDVVSGFNSLRKKPIIVVSTGGEFTQVLKKSLEGKGVPCFTFPEEAVNAIRELVHYYLEKG